MFTSKQEVLRSSLFSSYSAHGSVTYDVVKTRLLNCPEMGRINLAINIVDFTVVELPRNGKNKPGN